MPPTTNPESSRVTDGRLAVLDDPVEQGRFTRWVADSEGRKLAESTLLLAGMHCAACSGLIEQALCAVPGVRTASVSAASERATVCWDPEKTRPAELIAAVRKAGYDAVPDAAAPARELRRRAHRQALWRLCVAGFCGMQVMMMATPSYVAGPGELAPDLRQLLNWGSWLVSLPVISFAAGPFFRGAWNTLRHGRIGMDVPVALGVAITFIASTGATFDPAGVFGHEVYFDSLTMFVSFLLGSRYLELRARHAAAQSLESALACLPETAWRIGAAGEVEAVAVHRLQPGDRVRVPLGESFPADGTLESASTQADESLLSGESAPVPKQQGDGLVAGSVNRGAPVLMRVLRVGADTRLEAIVSMMRSAMSQRPASASLADRWAAPFLWAVLLLAAGGAAVWSVIDPSRAIWVAVSVLIVTCPCALSLAAPATLVAAARGLARRGVLLQRLGAIESLARVNQFFFDKTGTLTEDLSQLAAVHLTSAADEGFDAQRALQVAAGLAAWSKHPVALAMCAAARQAILLASKRPAGWPDTEQPWREIREDQGKGLRALDVQGREWRLGAASWVGFAAGPDADADADAHVVGDAGVCLGCEGQIWAGFVFEETLRPGAAEALRVLKADGLRVTVLSGDTRARAIALAERIGVADVVAEATPEIKLNTVREAQSQGRHVAMVGDGINDAPVLALADVSLAMGQGALVSRSQADAVVTSNLLSDVARARRTAVKAVRIVRQNLIWAATYNAICIPLALIGWLPPWAAGLGMALSSLLVIMNALRAAR